MFNSSFKEIEEFNYSTFIETCCPRLLLACDCLRITYGCFLWTHSTISFQRYLSLFRVWTWFIPVGLNARLHTSVLVIQNTYWFNYWNGLPYPLQQYRERFPRQNNSSHLSVSSGIFSKSTGIWCCIQTNIIVSKGFKSNLYIFRPQHSVLVAHNYGIRRYRRCRIINI